MLVKRIHYPLTTLGPGTRVGIWTVGCNKRCPGCMSQDLQKMDIKYEINVNDILLKIKKIKQNDENLGVTVTGGEPFLQEDLNDLIIGLKEIGINDILVYSGYSYEELMKMDKSYIQDTLKNISVLIDGEYIEELNDNLSLRGSSNQRILFFDKDLIDKYSSVLNKKREFEVVEHDGYLDFYGIFPIGMEKSIKSTLKRKNIQFTSSND